MKSIKNIKGGLDSMWSPYRLAIKGLIGGALILTAFQSTIQAQEVQYTRPSWYFGVAGGANFNFYRGTTQELNSTLAVPTAFHDGFGVGLYLAPLIEFHRPDTRFGAMLQLGYDNRSGVFNQVTTPCNCPADLSTDLSYFTVEPSLRFAPFKSNFYLYGGPRFAFNLSKSFTYKQGVNPDIAGQVAPADVKGDLSNTNDNLISMQIGAGYDIFLSSKRKHTQFVLSPFVSFQPYYGQDPRSIESLNVTTVRAGVALKLGRGHKIAAAEKVFIPAAVVAEPSVEFSVYAPKNIPTELSIREIFPIRNYVFFDIGSTDVPNRYVLLTKDQVTGFKEDNLEETKHIDLSGRSKRQMNVYYNVINILGERMSNDRSTTITLVGSSQKGPKDGKAMAESIKVYLVGVFAIDPSRIHTEGRIKPEIPSEQPGGKLELVLLREGDRRVSIESNSPVLLMEFQSGPDTPLRSVEILNVMEAPFESYVAIDVKGANKAYSSWSIEMADESGKVQKFGPYTQEQVSIPGKSILGSRPEGDYKVTMIGQTESGKVFKKETTAHIVLWTPSTTKEMMRFSILYEFNRSKAINLYEKYLTDVVIPKIPKDAKIIIHGHTDIIGGEDTNLKLSVARANDVKIILEKGLSKAGRSDIKFEVKGYGEDQNAAPFENKYPEERFYNRTVIIDIIPAL